MYTSFRCARAAVFYNKDSRLSMEQIKFQTGCSHIIGGYLFDNRPRHPDYLTPCGWTVVDGRELSRDAYNDWCFTCGKNGAPEMSTDKTASFVLSGIPILKDGKRLKRHLTLDVARPAERQAVCWLRDGQVLLWCDKKIMTREQLQDKLLALGVVDALMMDGGGSVQGSFPGKTLKSSRILSTFLLFWEDEEEKPVNKKFTVCLDAGHSASNTYNKSPDGSYFEHEFALDVVKRLKALLEAAGVEVIETRPDGRDVSLGERCRISNTAGVDLFVSLHSNATAQIKPGGWSDPRGLEVYVYSKSGKAAQAAQAIIKNMDNVGVMLRKYPMVEKPDLYVLKHTAAPALLIEHGFHTNKADVSLLKQKSYRQMLAIADAQGILDYLGVNYKIPGIPKPEKPDSEPPKEPTEEELAVKWITEAGIMRGNVDGDLMLDKAITRRQFAVMLYRALGKP